MLHFLRQRSSVDVGGLGPIICGVHAHGLSADPPQDIRSYQSVQSDQSAQEEDASVPDGVAANTHTAASAQLMNVFCGGAHAFAATWNAIQGCSFF